MANTFPNAKNQHLKNYVPVWTKKEMTDAAPNDYIDISWVDTEDDLVYDEKKLVTTETIKKLDQKITDNLVNLDERIAESIGNLDEEINEKLDNFKQKADEIVEKAVEHHIEDVKKVKEIASTLKKAIDDEASARKEQGDSLKEQIEKQSEWLSDRINNHIGIIYGKIDEEVSNREKADESLKEEISENLVELREEDKKIRDDFAAADKALKEELSAVDEKNFNALCDLLYEWKGEILVEKTIEIPVNGEAIVYHSFPENAKLNKFVTTVDDKQVYLYPDVFPVSEDNNLQAIELYDKKNAPNGFVGYDNITVTYTCTLGDFDKWKP